MRVASRAYVEFKRKIKAWQIANGRTVEAARKEIRDFFKSSFPEFTRDCGFSFKRRYYFPTKMLYTKNGSPKKIDLTNRIKALDDCICFILEIDDSLIFESSEKKIESTNSDEAYVSIEITPKCMSKLKGSKKPISKGVLDESGINA